MVRPLSRIAPQMQRILNQVSRLLLLLFCPDWRNWIRYFVLALTGCYDDADELYGIRLLLTD